MAIRVWLRNRMATRCEIRARRGIGDVFVMFSTAFELSHTLDTGKLGFLFCNLRCCFCHCCCFYFCWSSMFCRFIGHWQSRVLRCVGRVSWHLTRRSGHCNLTTHQQCSSLSYAKIFKFKCSSSTPVKVFPHIDIMMPHIIYSFSARLACFLPPSPLPLHIPSLLVLSISPFQLFSYLFFLVHLPDVCTHALFLIWCILMPVFYTQFLIALRSRVNAKLIHWISVNY